MAGRKLLRGGLALAFAATVLVPGSAQASPADRADRATRYIAQRQNPDGSFPSSFGSAHAATADAVLALVAARRGRSQVADAMEWLEEESATATSLGQKAKIVMAAVAAGRDVGDEPWSSLVSDIKNAYDPLTGAYASSPFSQVFDQNLAILALKAADKGVSRAAVMWLVDAQCPDGGWQFDQPRTPGEDRKCYDSERDGGDFTKSDTNTTSYAVMALVAARKRVELEAKPFKWLRARIDPVKRGWGYDRKSRLTESVSTALVIQAHASRDRRLPRGAWGALAKLQRGICGDFADGFSRGWEKVDGAYEKIAGADMGSTVAAIPGLLRKPFPLEPASFLRQVPPPPPCPAP